MLIIITNVDLSRFLRQPAYLKIVIVINVELSMFVRLFAYLYIILTVNYGSMVGPLKTANEQTDSRT